MATIVPPGGFAGFSQMTQASQRALGSAVRRATGTRKRKKRAKSTTTRKRAKKSGGKKARLVKGSAAAKAYMAKIRKKRK